MNSSEENLKVPLDIRIVSIVLFISAFAYFQVNTNVFILYGIIVSGYMAKMLWVISCAICLICSYGFWTKKLLAWKIMIGYTAFYLGNCITNYFSVSDEKRALIALEQIPDNISYSSSIFFLLFYLLIYSLFIFYLVKRRKIFVARELQELWDVHK